MCNPLYVNYLSCCFDKKPNKCNLRKEDWGYSPRGYNPSCQGRYGMWRRRQLLTWHPGHSQEAERNECCVLFTSFSFILEPKPRE